VAGEERTQQETASQLRLLHGPPAHRLIHIRRPTKAGRLSRK
jgi:hypothetical protein